MTKRSYVFTVIVKLENLRKSGTDLNIERTPMDLETFTNVRVMRVMAQIHCRSETVYTAQDTLPNSCSLRRSGE